MLKISIEGELLFRFWSPEYVVYNVSTSNSHVLDSITADFLLEVQKNALTKTEANTFFANRLVNNSVQQIENHVDNIISDLQKIYLIKVT